MAEIPRVQSAYYVALLKNVHDRLSFRVDRCFSDKEVAAALIEKIKPSCRLCVFRIDCLTSDHCLRLRFIELQPNGVSKNLLPKFGLVDPKTRRPTARGENVS